MKTLIMVLSFWLLYISSALAVPSQHGLDSNKKPPALVAFNFKIISHEPSKMFMGCQGYGYFIVESVDQVDMVFAVCTEDFASNRVGDYIEIPFLTE